MFYKFNASISPHLKELLRGGLLGLSVKLLSILSAFFLNIALTRYLSPDQVGYFFLSQAIIVIFAVVARQGFDNALVRFIAGYNVSGEAPLVAGIYRYALMRIIPALIILTFLLWLASGFISVWVFDKPLLSCALAVGSLAVLPISIAQLHGFCLQGKKSIVFALLFQSALLTLLASLIIWYAEPKDAFQAMAGYSFSAVIVLLFSIIVWFRHGLTSLPVFPCEEKKLVTKSINSLFIISLLSQAALWSAPLIIGAFGSASDVALFSIALKSATVVSFILIAVNSIAAPKFAEAYKKYKLCEVRVIFRNSTQIMILAALPLIIFMLIYAEWLMGLFGKEYVEGADVLRILAIGQFINVITGPVGFLLQMTGHEKTLRNNFFISSLIMIVGCFIVVPLYGVFGGAIVVALSMTSQNLLCFFQVKKKLGFSPISLSNKN